MKAITPHAGVVQGARQGEALVHVTLVGMEGGVEAGKLWHAGKGSNGSVYARQVVGLVQWCQRHKALEFFEHGQVDRHRVGKPGAAVHDAVTDRTNRSAGGVALAPGQHRVERTGMGGVGLRQYRLMYGASPRVLYIQARSEPGTKPLYLPGPQGTGERGTGRGYYLGSVKQRKLDRRRSGVEREQLICHGVPGQLYLQTYT